jgi:hypothetical protein
MTVGYSVLFCDRARSEDRMAPSNKPTGEIAPEGFSPAWLRERCDSINAGDCGFSSYIVDLTENCPHPCEEACVMVVRPSSKATADACLREIEAVKFDTFTSARGKVLNAHTRHLAFLGEEARSPDASTGEHTVLGWSQSPATDRARQELVGLLGALPYVRSGCALKYPDILKCGIGWHGDGERRQTIIYRVGDSSFERPLCFQWYLQGEAVGPVVTVHLQHGDYLVSSAKAVGTDWKVRKVPTLRHATGFLSQGAAPRATAKAEKRKRAEGVEEGRSVGV